MRISTLIVVITILTSGCSSLSYQEPTSGPRARVRFATETENLSILRTYDDQNCSTNETEWLRLRNGIMINSSPKRMGMPLWNYHENAAKEVYVDTRKPLYGLFEGSSQEGAYIYRCATPFAYKFKENTDYEVLFAWNRMICHISISEIANSPSGYQKHEVATFNSQVNDSNKGCLDAFHKMRLY